MMVIKIWCNPEFMPLPLASAKNGKEQRR